MELMEYFQWIFKIKNNFHLIESQAQKKGGGLKTLEMTYATSNINFKISGQAVHFLGQEQ